MSFVLCDTETTGVSPNKDKVCEVAWRFIDDDFNTLDSDVSLINPCVSIPSGASAVNGITDLMVQDALTLDEYFAQVGDIFNSSDLIFIAHNASFDRSFLRNYIHPEARSLCTLRASRELYPQADSHKLSALAYSLGLEIDRSKVHSADGDLDLLQQLLMRMCEDAQCGIEDLLKLVVPKKVEVMPFGKHKGVKLAHLPKSYVSWLLTEANIDDDLRTSLMSL